MIVHSSAVHLVQFGSIEMAVLTVLYLDPVTGEFVETILVFDNENKAMKAQEHITAIAALQGSDSYPFTEDFPGFSEN